MVDRDFTRYEQNKDGSIRKTVYEQDRIVESKQLTRVEVRREYPNIDKLMPDISIGKDNNL